jgi:transposase
MRAIVVVEHAMVIAAWNLLVNSDFYRDPGPDYYTARQPARTRARALSQLQTLGYRVTLEPLTQAG